MSYIHLPKKRQPILLRPDNFCPPSRTPWGGTKIATRYKGLSPRVIGESWEISVEPDFPSRTEPDGAPLDEPTTLLVKLLDAADVLSVQIHPSDEYPGLAPGECGKPESWYVVEREPGGALYIGLRDGVDAPAMRGALQRGEDVSALLVHVPVEPGDFFVIEAGTPHAIGAGVTLVEPQRVVPGQRGVTYRYWDWNRTYDGKSRELHVEHALAVTRWDAPRGEAFVDSIRHRAGAPALDAPLRIESLVAPGGRLSSRFLQVHRLAGTGRTEIPARETLLGLTVLDGEVTLDDVVVGRGRSAVIPGAAAGAAATRVSARSAHAILAAAT